MNTYNAELAEIRLLFSTRLWKTVYMYWATFVLEFGKRNTTQGRVSQTTQVDPHALSTTNIPYPDLHIINVTGPQGCAV